jgi:anti-sigma B factor antagonist
MRRGELNVWTDEWDGVPVIGAEGEVDLGTVDQLRKAASELVRQRPATLIFDLRKVTFIDSSGLGILVAARKQLGGEFETVTIVTDQPAVLQSLEITGLTRIFAIQREPAAQPV